MTSGARVEAQAKLNLFLRVFGREPSGYHQLETLFCRIALADTITVDITDAGRSLDVSGRVPAGGGTQRSGVQCSHQLPQPTDRCGTDSNAWNDLLAGQVWQTRGSAATR